METHNTISAKELFGSMSHFAEQSEEAVLSDTALLGSFYQVATAIVAILFIYILVRYFNVFRYLIISAIDKRANNSDIHIYSSEINNIKILTSIVGVVLLSLLMMRLSVFEEVKHLLVPLPYLSVWGIGCATFVAITIVILIERTMLYILGVASEQSKFCNTIWHLKLLNFSTTIVLIAPMLISALLTEGLTSRIALYASFAICSISIVLFIKETFSLFHSQRFSIFHWILYLCALEIFPLSLLLAPIARG